MTGQEGAAADELRYRVPNGQDPAPLMAALHEAGYEASSESVEGDRRLVITCPNGVDRDRASVRKVIAESNRTSMLDGIPLDREVLFEGERPER